MTTTLTFNKRKTQGLLTTTVSSVGDDYGVHFKHSLKVHPPPSIRVGVDGGCVGALTDRSVFVAIYNVLWSPIEPMVGALSRWLVQRDIC